MVREELNPDIEIEGILPTLVDNRTVHAKEAIEILEENFGERVFASRINKTVRFAEAPVKGMSVLKYDPDGKAAYAYRRLAGGPGEWQAVSGRACGRGRWRSSSARRTKRRLPTSRRAPTPRRRPAGRARGRFLAAAGARPAGPAPHGGARVHRRTAEAEGQAQDSFASRASEAARRAEERSERRRAEREHPEESRVSRYEGVPTPEERLRSVFSSDIPENMMERAPEHESYPASPAAVARLQPSSAAGGGRRRRRRSTPSTA